MRLVPLDERPLTEEQRTVLREAASGPRRHVPKPMLGWLSSPEMARRAQHLGAFVRYETTLPPASLELAILVTARHWSCAYAWQAHAREALKAGLDPRIVADVAARRNPAPADATLRLIHDVAATLLATRRVPDELFAEAVRVLGQRGVSELLGVIGYYGLVAMTLNTFEVPLPEGRTAEISHDD